MTTTAKRISDDLLAAIETAENVPAMSKAWATVQRIDSLNDLGGGRIGTFFDGRLIVTVAEDGSNHAIDVAGFAYRTELVIRAMRDADRDAASQEPQTQDQPRRGRPEIGEPVQVRLGWLLPAVDSYAEREGIKRAAAIRELVKKGLAATA